MLRSSNTKGAPAETNVYCRSEGFNFPSTKTERCSNYQRSEDLMCSLGLDNGGFACREDCVFVLDVEMCARVTCVSWRLAILSP